MNDKKRLIKLWPIEIVFDKAKFPQKTFGVWINSQTELNKLFLEAGWYIVGEINGGVVLMAPQLITDEWKATVVIASVLLEINKGEEQ